MKAPNPFLISKNHVVELALYQTQVAAPAHSHVLVAEANQVLHTLPGLVSRHVLLATDDDRQLVDVVQWQTQADADMAMKQIGKLPGIGSFFSLIAPGSARVRHLQPVHAYGLEPHTAPAAVEMVAYTFRPDALGQRQQFFDTYTARMQGVPGYQGRAILQDVEDPHQWVEMALWESPEQAAVNAKRLENDATMAQLYALLQGVDMMKIFSVLQ